MTVPGYSPSYNGSSPYAFTKITRKYMTYYVHRPIRANALDRSFLLDTARYVFRPDLLATDIYGDVEKYWVIPLRNGLQDPVFDLVYGMTLIIPDPSYIRGLF